MLIVLISLLIEYGSYVISRIMVHMSQSTAASYFVTLLITHFFEKIFYAFRTRNAEHVISKLISQQI